MTWLPESKTFSFNLFIISLETLSNELSINFNESSFDPSLFIVSLIISNFISGINLFTSFISFFTSKISLTFLIALSHKVPSILNWLLVKYILFNSFILSMQKLRPLCNSYILFRASGVPSLSNKLTINII